METNKSEGQRFVLGCDIDGCLADFIGACAFLACKDYGKNLWPLLRLPTATQELEDIMSYYTYDPEIYRWLNPIPYAASTLRRLQREMGIVYITARPMFAKVDTWAWLELHGFPKMAVINVRNDSKLAAVKREKVDLYIEDRPKYANPLAAAGVEVVLLDVYDRNPGKLHENVRVASSWRAIERLLRKRLEK